jgi:hypothetical protein
MQAAMMLFALSTGASFLDTPSLELSAEAGRRWGDWGLVGKLEWNPWLRFAGEEKLVKGVINFGVGGEYLFFDQRCRTALAVGVSRLSFDTEIDQKGEKGVFVDVIPVGLRYPLGGSGGNDGGGFTLRFDPLTFHVIEPVIDDVIPLVIFEYRTRIAIEWTP